MAKMAPAAPPIMVFIKDIATACPWPGAPTIANSEPPLKAKKPRNRIKPPNEAIGTECPGILNCFFPSSYDINIL